MNTKTKVIGGFLVGAAAGALSGILLAPRSGRKTRKKIKDESQRMADELIEKANESLSAIKRNYNNKLDRYTKTGKASVDGLSETFSVH